MKLRRPAIMETHAIRRRVLVEVDNDGEIDGLIVNLNEPPSVLCDGPTCDNHSLKIDMIGVKSNRCLIRATVAARYREGRQAGTGTDFYSANDWRPNFGIRKNRAPTLRLAGKTGWSRALPMTGPARSAKVLASLRPRSSTASAFVGTTLSDRCAFTHEERYSETR